MCAIAAPHQERYCSVCQWIWKQASRSHEALPKAKSKCSSNVAAAKVPAFASRIGIVREDFASWMVGYTRFFRRKCYQRLQSGRFHQTHATDSNGEGTLPISVLVIGWLSLYNQSLLKFGERLENGAKNAVHDFVAPFRGREKRRVLSSVVC